VRSLRKLLSVAVAATILTGATGCSLVSKTEEGKKNEVVAKVGKEKITKAELDKSFAPFMSQIEMEKGKDYANTNEGQGYIKDQKIAYLDQMTQEKLILQKGKELNLLPDDKAVEDKTNEMLNSSVQAAGGQEKFNEQIKTALNMSFDEYKVVVKNYMKVQLTEEKLYENAAKDVTVSDEEAKTYYNENLYNYTEKPNKLYFSHILVNDTAEADKVKKELDGGADFAATAKKYSQDPGSKDNGGAYAEGLEYANLDESFLVGALSQPVGKIGAPVKGSYGYHIIKVTKKEEYPAKPFDNVKAEIKQSLLGEKKSEVYSKALEEWKKKADIKTYPDKV
jgi:foldase protein PrsA